LLCFAIVVVYGSLFATVLRAQARHPAVAQIPVPTPAPTATYHNGFDFADSVPIADRQWIAQAVAHARPEAVRLIELIDNRTTVAPLQAGSNLGLTGQLASGRYQIMLDLKTLDGEMRANRELVLLHELGHVVDDEFVPDSLRDRLAAEVPTSGFCRGRLGDCAPPEEKFADTFAKWAYRGALSFSDGAGYYLPVPPLLDAWGAPLTRLARTPLYAAAAVGRNPAFRALAALRDQLAKAREDYAHAQHLPLQLRRQHLRRRCLQSRRPGGRRLERIRPHPRGRADRGLPGPPPVTNLRLTPSCPGLHRTATRTRILSVHRRGPSTVVTVQVSSRRKPTGAITLTAPGLKGARGFVDARHPRATLVLAGHLRKRAHLVARYAGNARCAPSRGHKAT
jgi:hypothetical protein